MGWEVGRVETMHEKVISWSAWDFGENLLKAGLPHTALLTSSARL